MAILKSRRHMLGADILVVSHGKSGRTWLRALLNKYLSLHYSVPFSLDGLHEQNPDIPVISYQHRLWISFNWAPQWLNRMLDGIPLLSHRDLLGKKVIFLARDPRDIIVSNYFQITRRARPDKRIDDISISDFIRHPYWGIANVVRLMNKYHDALYGHPHCLRVTYESMKADVSEELTQVLRFVGIAEPDPQLLADTIAFGDFDNMQRMERGGEFSKAMLRPGNPDDLDSLKVRKGKVGGYVEYLDGADLAYVEQNIAALRPEFGYANPRESDYR